VAVLSRTCPFHQGGANTKGPKIEADGRQRGWGSCGWEEGSRPFLIHIIVHIIADYHAATGAKTPWPSCVRSWLQYQQAVQSRLAHLSIVFSRSKAEKLRSAVADMAGTSSNQQSRILNASHLEWDHLETDHSAASWCQCVLWNPQIFWWKSSIRRATNSEYFSYCTASVGPVGFAGRMETPASRILAHGPYVGRGFLKGVILANHAASTDNKIIQNRQKWQNKTTQIQYRINYQQKQRPMKDNAYRQHIVTRTCCYHSQKIVEFKSMHKTLF